MESSLPRFRNFALSKYAFECLAIANAVMLVLVVGTGATVRVTESGLGCRHWPGCQPGEVLPAQGFHSKIEFSNRIVAVVTVLVALLTLVGALLTPTLSRAGRWFAAGALIGAIGQIPLGALTVYYDLNPWFVISHLLLSILVIGLGVLAVLEAFDRPRAMLSTWQRVLAAGVGLSCAVLVVTGTFVTASGPFPGSFNGKPIERLGSFHPAIWVHVRATAVFGILLAALIIWLLRDKVPRVVLAWPVLGVLGIQMIVGEVQYRDGFPWWLILIHVTLAASLWATVVALTAGLLRPSRMR